MAKSRYSQTPMIRDASLYEPLHYATFDLTSNLKGYQGQDLLDKDLYHEYIWQFGDRLDRLSNKYMNDDQYWWIICMVNNISYPLSIAIGTVIKIPSDPRPILERMGLV